MDKIKFTLILKSVSKRDIYVDYESETTVGFERIETCRPKVYTWDESEFNELEKAVADYNCRSQKGGYILEIILFEHQDLNPTKLIEEYREEKEKKRLAKERRKEARKKNEASRKKKLLEKKRKELEKLKSELGE